MESQLPHASHASRTVKTKLRKQELLLRRVEGVEQQLRQKVWAWEKRTNAKSIDSDSSLWLDGISGVLESSNVTSPDSFGHNKPSRVPTGDGNFILGCLKGSRSVVGMNSIDIISDGCEGEKVTQPGIGRPSPSTRINMLPVMSSTGQREACVSFCCCC